MTLSLSFTSLNGSTQVLSRITQFTSMARPNFMSTQPHYSPLERLHPLSARSQFTSTESPYDSQIIRRCLSHPIKCLALWMLLLVVIVIALHYMLPPRPHQNEMAETLEELNKALKENVRMLEEITQTLKEINKKLEENARIREGIIKTLEEIIKTLEDTVEAPGVLEEIDEKTDVLVKERM